MGITDTFSPLGTRISRATSYSLPLYLAGAISAQAAVIDLDTLQDDLGFPTEGNVAGLVLSGNELGGFAADGRFAFLDDDTLAGTIDTGIDWDQVAPASSLFDSKFADQIAAIREAAEERKALIRETIDITQNGAIHDLRYATFEPIGVTSEQAPMTFTHVGGTVGITDEIIDGETKRYVVAYTGIDTDAAIMEQVTADPRGIHNIGDLVTTDSPDIKISENARVAAMFTQEQGGIEELQISVGYDMVEDEDIVLTLRDSDGEVIRTIDANEFQVQETPDFLVLIIKDDEQALSAIYDNMLANGSFDVEARSPMGRKVLSEFDFGPYFAQDVDLAYSRLNEPGYHFDATQEFKRRVAYDPEAAVVNKDVTECVFLGLQELSDEQLEGIRVVMGEVTDGTAMPTRDFTALVALDEFNNVVAAGSQAWWGINYETDTVRRSGSSDTRFTTNGGNVFSGCTDDKITTIIPPQETPPGANIPGQPHTGTPYFPWSPSTPYYVGGGVPPFFGDTPDNPYNPHDPVPPTAAVPTPGTGILMLTGLAALGAAMRRRRQANPANDQKTEAGLNSLEANVA